jgi:hypothetical protein
MIGKGTEAKNAPNFPVSMVNNRYQTWDITLVIPGVCVSAVSCVRVCVRVLLAISPIDNHKRVNYQCQDAEIMKLVQIILVKTVPNTEKKIIKPAEIWITLLLPTFVNASKPAFSLKKKSKAERN